MAEDIPFRIAWEEFSARFPTLDEALLVVVDAETPELARESADVLAAHLQARDDAFRDVFVPGAGEFFERNGLLYRSVDELDTLADRIAEVQPIVAELAREASISNLARLIRLGLQQVREEGAEERDWPAILDRVGHATVAAYQEHPVRVSWEDVLLTGSAIDPSARRVIVAEPILDYERVLAAARPMEAIRRAAVELGLGPERGVRVRVTGNPALNYEEMLGLLWDIGFAGLFSIAFICGILYFALRSARLAAASIITLVAGLVWTAAFAAATVERLNLVSIAFAVLFVGLGIDFAIHLGVHYEHLRRRGESHGPALGDAVRSVGSALAICTLTTAIGFFAFIPTDFRGVGELGLISGTGMFVIFFLTLTLFPALLALWVKSKADWPAKEGPLRLSRLSAAQFHPRRTLAVACLAGLGALLLLPRIQFHSNVVKMRDPEAESVQTFEDLLAEAQTTPWQIDLVARDLDAARELTQRLRELDVVDRAVSLADYVPDEQEEKIEILGDLALLLDVPAQAEPASPLPAEEQIEALRELHAILDRPWLVEAESPLAASALRLRGELADFLERVEEDPNADEALASLEQILLGRLPEQLDRLRLATQPDPFGLEDLPEHIVRRMLAADGRARVQVFPSENVSDHEALVRFVDGVRAVSPDATGLATHILEFSRATASSLREALLFSLALVAALLWILWRRATEMGLALAPLLLGAALSGAAMVFLGMPFNYGNVIVIPLLLGMGVDSGIHLVHRGIHLAQRSDLEGGLTGTHTARAVFYSSLTTIASFGSLALSSHRAIASLGTLLVIGMVLTLSCNLLVLPALIEIYRGRSAKRLARAR
jgi:hopanoid biosynthesis associated RND transporter like protein HpnN